MTKTQINLLARLKGGGGRPPQLHRPFKPSFFVLIFSFILIGFEIAFLITFYQRLSNKEEALQKKHAGLTEEISTLQRELVKLKTQEEGKKETPDTSRIADRLKEEGQNLVKVLEAVSQNLPTQAWISYLSQKENGVIVNGFAVDHEAIANFLSKLQRSSYFQNVKLVISEQLVDPKNPVKKFTVTCDVFVGKL